VNATAFENKLPVPVTNIMMYNIIINKSASQVGRQLIYRLNTNFIKNASRKEKYLTYAGVFVFLQPVRKKKPQLNIFLFEKHFVLKLAQGAKEITRRNPTRLQPKIPTHSKVVHSQTKKLKIQNLQGCVLIYYL